jgi:hypothetical protein
MPEKTSKAARGKRVSRVASSRARNIRTGASSRLTADAFSEDFNRHVFSELGVWPPDLPGHEEIHPYPDVDQRVCVVFAPWSHVTLLDLARCLSAMVARVSPASKQTCFAHCCHC